MMEWAAVAASAAAVALALWANARAYAARVERRWPPLGPILDINRARIHIAEAGAPDAPPLLLIHGASANLRELWSPIGLPLADTYRVIAFDRPGYGHSTRPRRATALRFQADIAAEVLAERGVSRALVVAHSLGAGVALRLAIERPDLVAGLVLIAPASHPYPGKNVWWARLAAKPLIGDAFAGLIVPLVGPVRSHAGAANSFAPAPAPKGYYEDAGVGLAVRPRAFRASALDVVASKKEFAAQAPRYPEILAPTLIISADVDKVVSPRIHARPLAADLPVAELITAPDAGHMPHRVRPDLVIAAVRRVEAMASANASD